MNEKELYDFVQKNPESQTIEYKLKPNFNDIKKTIEHIKDRMHFNILKTIYAFANTDGGELFIGIKEIKNNRANKSNWDIVGVDDSDLGIIISILKKINPQITIQKNTIELKKQKRKVLRINVDKLKLYDRPQLLNGILYYREDDNTTQLKSFESGPKIYQKELFYLFILAGIKSNLHKTTKAQDDFIANQFIEGLEFHIKDLANKNKTADYEQTKQVLQLLDEIKLYIKNKREQSITEFSDTYTVDIPALINSFVKAYKAFIDLEV